MLTSRQQRRIISNRKGVIHLSTIGSRIRNRREELGLSQDELGKRLGYKSRSSINKIELDQRNLTQSKIKAIADALDTTPAYIMGWNEPNQKLDAEKLKFFVPLKPSVSRCWGILLVANPLLPMKKRNYMWKLGPVFRLTFAYGQGVIP